MLLSDAAEADEDARLFFTSRDASATPSHVRAVSPAEHAGAHAAGAEGAGSRRRREPEAPPPPRTRARSLRRADAPPHRARGVQRRVLRAVPPPPPTVLRDLDTPFPAAAARLDAVRLPCGKHPRRACAAASSPRSTWRRAVGKFVIVTNAGVVLVEKARPLDALRELLLDDVHEHIARFFAAYGQAEAATMCLALALGAGAPSTSASSPRASAEPPPSLSGARAWAPAPRRAARSSRRARPRRPRWPPPPRARLALEDPRLTGEPRVEDDGAEVGDLTGVGAPRGPRESPARGGRGAVRHGPRHRASALALLGRARRGVHKRGARPGGGLGAPRDRRAEYAAAAPAKDERGGEGAAAAGTARASPRVQQGSTGFNRLRGEDSARLRRTAIFCQHTLALAGAASAAAGWLGGMLMPSSQSSL